MRPDLDGLLLIDKPEGPTSHDIVARARARTGQPRIGHTGTLDPMASGLLVLALGRATRLIRYLPGTPKLYTGSLRLGLTTSSDDITGQVLERFEGPFPAPDRVREAAAGFVGRSHQVPPRVSARKVGGERLYRMARRGIRCDEHRQIRHPPGSERSSWSSPTANAPGSGVAGPVFWLLW